MLGTRESLSSDFWREYPAFEPRDGNTVAALVHGLGILRLLALNRGGLSLSDIAERVGIGKTTAFRLLNTLVQTGYARQDHEAKSYAIDYSILELTGFILHGFEARSRAGPYLYDLAGKTGLTVVLSVLRGDVVVVIERVAPRTVRVQHTEIGFRLSAHASANGKATLANLTTEALGHYLARGPFRAFTERTITDPAALREHLQRVREQGFAINDGEWIPNVRSIAAPIRNFNGDVIAGVGISSHDLLPEGQGKGIGEVLEHVPAVIEAAESISFSLGYHAANLV